MHSLATIQRLNNQFEVAKSRRRAVAMNKPSGHAKDAEKGRRTKRKRRTVALDFETNYDAGNGSLISIHSAEDLRDLGVRT